MTFEKSIEILDKIDKAKNIYLKNDLISIAIDYARIRTDFYIYDIEARKEKDQSRSSKHNALIDACNILSRDMVKNNEDASWRIDLTDNRKEIGDFACHLHAILGIKMR